eukprot:scaffold252322_cov40-Tisochrysis_lutea.AAC.1
MTAVLTIAALTVVRLPACCPITQTLAEKEGGADILGAAGVGLTGTIPVVFRQGNDTLTTMATAGQPLSSVRKLATISASGDVAAQAGQYIKYKCRKGECGTCAVRVDGQWIKTCSVSIPFVPEGESYEVRAHITLGSNALGSEGVFVRGTMVKPSKSSRFFSFKSFIAGFRNNFLGMVGFVKEGPLSRKGKVRVASLRPHMKQRPRSDCTSPGYTSGELQRTHQRRARARRQGCCAQGSTRQRRRVR